MIQAPLTIVSSVKKYTLLLHKHLTTLEINPIPHLPTLETVHLRELDE